MLGCRDNLSEDAELARRKRRL